MALSIVRYQDGTKVNWGRLTGEAPDSPDSVVSVTPLQIGDVSTAEVIKVFESGKVSSAESAPKSFPARNLLSPITSNATIICQGLNYADHAAEAQHQTRKQNLFFSKASSSLTGAYSDIVRPEEVNLLDYEVEFGVVLRTLIPREIEITKKNVGEFVAGVVLCNDVSARDVMFGASFLQWYQGKSYRTFCPAGPVLYLLDPPEVAEVLENLEIQLSVNGEQRQSSTSSKLIFKPAQTLSQLSKIVDLKCGDLLLTGTPAGVTAPASPKLVEILKTHLMADVSRREELTVEMSRSRPFLQPGDVVTAKLRDAHFGINLGGQQNQISGG